MFNFAGRATGWVKGVASNAATSEELVAYHSTRLHQAGRWRAVLWRWRWVGYALVILGVFQAIVSALAATHPAQLEIVVAARDLSAGQELTARDLKLISVPASAAPPQYLPQIDDALAQHVVAAIPAGAPILRGQLLGDEFLASAPPGTVIAAVPLADTGGLQLLQVGNQVDLYAPPDEFSSSATATLVAAGISIVGAYTEPGQSTLLTEQPGTAVFYLALPDFYVADIVGQAALAPLHAVLSGPKPG
ncbi:MAG: SAF domain-containing protein [Trueperella sp.]|nr:SAF domain-containing protein [Trueperella sp.]